MTLQIIVISAILAVFLTYTLLVPTVLGLPQFIGKFPLPRPVHGAHAGVRLNPAGAALTSAYGAPSLHVRRSNPRNRGEECGKNCLAAVKAQRERVECRSADWRSDPQLPLRKGGLFGGGTPGFSAIQEVG